MRNTLILCLSLCLSAAAFAAPAAGYQVSHKFVIGGDGGWDYISLDPAGKRLFISRATRVQVMDTADGKLLGEIPDTQGVHGIALAPDLGKGYTSNGREDTVTVFDLKSLKTLTKIKVSGQNPDAILYEPKTHRVFTFNGRSGNSTVIDAVKDAVVATIPLDGRPEFAVADGAGRVYVNIEDKSELSAIDAAQAAVTRTWSLAPCQEPSGLAIDVAHRRLFSGCDNKLMAVSDADAGKVVATAPIGEGVDAGRFDPGTQLVFMSCGEGVLSVIHEDSPDRYTKVEDAPSQKYARTMDIDLATHDAYLVTADVHVTPAPAGATGAAARPKREVQPGTFTVLVMHRP